MLHFLIVSPDSEWNVNNMRSAVVVVVVVVLFLCDRAYIVHIYFNFPHYFSGRSVTTGQIRLDLTCYNYHIYILVKNDGSTFVKEVWTFLKLRNIHVSKDTNKVG